MSAVNARRWALETPTRQIPRTLGYRARVLILMGITLATPDYASASATEGRRLVDQKCAGCHATADAGESASADAPTFRSLFRRYPVAALRQSFLKGLQVGHRNMPAFTLKPQEVTDIISYLEGLNPCSKPSSDTAAMKACFEPM